jgi:WD40 repeat protein
MKRFLWPLFLLTPFLLYLQWGCLMIPVCDTDQDCKNRGYSFCNQGRCDDSQANTSEITKETVEEKNPEERTDGGEKEASPVESIAENPPQEQPPEPQIKTACLPTQLSGSLGEELPSLSKVVINAQGTMIATNPYDQIHLWDIQTGKILHKLKGHQAQILGLAFSPDGTKIASSSQDGEIHLWSTASGQQLTSSNPNNHKEQVTSLAFSPDGQRLASASYDGTVRIWEPSTGKMLHSSYPTGQLFNSVAFTPDGLFILASSWAGQLWKWPTETFTSPKTYHLPDSTYHLAVHPQGDRIALSLSSNEAVILDLNTGLLTRRFNNYHQSVVFGSTFSKDGNFLFTASHDKTVVQWNAQTGERIRVFTGHRMFINSIAIHPQKNQFVTSSFDKTARLWDIETGLTLQVFGQTAWWTGIAISPNGRFLASSNQDNHTQIWELPSRQPKQTLLSATPSHAVAFSPDSSQVLTASDDQRARLWETETGRLLAELKNRGSVLSVAFDPKGKYMASGDVDGRVMVWNTKTFELDKFLTQEGAILHLAFTPDGKSLLSAGLRGKAILWDLEKSTPKNSLLGHTGNITALAIQPQGQRIATFAIDNFKNTLRIWDKEGHPLHIINHLSNPLGAHSIAFRADGQVLALANSDKNIRLWEVESGKFLGTLQEHRGAVHGVAFHPFLHTLVSGSFDNSILFWECP